MENTNETFDELELILTFLGIEFIDYNGKRCSSGHKTAKTIGEIKAFFGKEVMTSGQYIKDAANWFDFKNDWNDLMFLVEKIINLKGVYAEPRQKVYSSISPDKEKTYAACVEFINWYNSSKK